MQLFGTPSQQIRNQDERRPRTNQYALTDLFSPNQYALTDLFSPFPGWLSRRKTSRGNRWRWSWSRNWLWSARSALWWRVQCRHCVSVCIMHSLYVLLLLSQGVFIIYGRGWWRWWFVKIGCPPKTLSPPLKNTWNTWETNSPPPPHPHDTVWKFLSSPPPPSPPPTYFKSMPLCDCCGPTTVLIHVMSLSPKTFREIMH